MRIRKLPWCAPELEACPFCIDRPRENRNHWKESFPKNQPLHIELGCGKGGFISALAPTQPQINFLAVDIKNEMLGRAKRKLEAAYDEANLTPDNVRIFITDIELIGEVLGPEDVVERIYINFCNPWPRGKHFKKRLTHPKQLAQYKSFLRDGGEIWFKTDNQQLFNSSKHYFLSEGFEITFLTEHLEANPCPAPEFSPVTEHQLMFSEEGITTKMLIAKKNPA